MHLCTLTFEPYIQIVLSSNEQLRDLDVKDKHLGRTSVDPTELIYFLIPHDTKLTHKVTLDRINWKLFCGSNLTSSVAGARKICPGDGPLCLHYPFGVLGPYTVLFEALTKIDFLSLQKELNPRPAHQPNGYPSFSI